MLPREWQVRIGDMVAPPIFLRSVTSRHMQIRAGAPLEHDGDPDDLDLDDLSVLANPAMLAEVRAVGALRSVTEHRLAVVRVNERHDRVPSDEVAALDAEDLEERIVDVDDCGAAANEDRIGAAVDELAEARLGPPKRGGELLEALGRPDVWVILLGHSPSGPAPGS